MTDQDIIDTIAAALNGRGNFPLGADLRPEGERILDALKKSYVLTPRDVWGETMMHHEEAVRWIAVLEGVFRQSGVPVPDWGDVDQKRYTIVELPQPAQDLWDESDTAQFIAAHEPIRVCHSDIVLDRSWYNPAAARDIAAALLAAADLFERRQ